VVNATTPPLYPRERPGIGGWVDPRAGLDLCEKSRPTGIRSQDRPARSALLYRLRYPGPCVCVCSLSYPACYVYAPYYVVICGLSDSTSTVGAFAKLSRGTISFVIFVCLSVRAQVHMQVRTKHSGSYWKNFHVI
jgi:hypothetical protein